MLIRSVDPSGLPEFVNCLPWRRLRAPLSAAVVLGALSVGQAFAQETEPVAAPTPVSVSASEPVERQDKVCEYEVVTGSRMRKRVCYTPEQWAARERAGRELTRELDSRAIGERGGN